MDGPSTHLTWEELKCHDGTSYPDRFITDGRVTKLALAFEDIRALCGNKPIIVLSAYRTPSWNKKVGGASKSQHMQGRALDLKPPAGFTVKQFHKLIWDNCKVFQITGLGLYKTFVHIDIRPSDRLVTWSSSNITGENSA